MDLQEQFVGSWSLVSWNVTSEDGTVAYPFGDDAVGRITYDQGGHMAAHLMRRQRTASASANPFNATQEDQLASYREYFSYYGDFTIQPDAETVTHHVEGATFPQWVGSDQLRHYAFAGDQLTLSLVYVDGSRHALVWKRLNP